MIILITMIGEVKLARTKNNEIKSLTGIRGIFAVYVMMFHINPFSSTSHFISNGYISVDLFFVLSGFILSFVYESRFKYKVSDSDYILYLANRAIRIYPLYLFILVLVSIYYITTNPYPTLIYDITSNILFMQSVTGNGFIGPAWSLSTEVIAYLLMPFMILILIKRKSFLIVSVYASLCLLGYVAYSLGRLDVFSGWQAIARCLSEYVLGISSYLLFRKIKTKDNSLLCIAITILLLFLLSFRGFDVFVVLSFSVLIPLIASSSGVVSKVLSCAPVFYLGEISYSIYLWHGVISRQFSEHVIKLSHALGIENALLSMVAITMILSCVTYHLLELPCKAMLKKHTKKLIVA